MNNNADAYTPLTLRLYCRDCDDYHEHTVTATRCTCNVCQLSDSLTSPLALMDRYTYRTTHGLPLWETK